MNVRWHPLQLSCVETTGRTQLMESAGLPYKSLFSYFWQLRTSALLLQCSPPLLFVHVNYLVEYSLNFFWACRRFHFRMSLRTWAITFRLFSFFQRCFCLWASTMETVSPQTEVPRMSRQAHFSEEGTYWCRVKRIASLIDVRKIWITRKQG